MKDFLKGLFQLLALLLFLVAVFSLMSDYWYYTAGFIGAFAIAYYAVEKMSGRGV